MLGLGRGSADIGTTGELAKVVREAHEEHFRRFDSRLEGRWERKRKEHMLTALRSLEFGRDATLLDAGSGPGFLLESVSGIFSDMVAVDFSSSILEMVKHRVRARCVQASVTNLPFRDRCFDVVLSSEVLQHVTDVTQSVRELFRVSRRAVMIVIPNLGTLERLGAKVIPSLSEKVHPLRNVTLQLFEAVEFCKIAGSLGGKEWALRYLKVPHVFPSLVSNALPPRLEPLLTFAENILNRLLPRSGVKAFIVYQRVNDLEPTPEQRDGVPPSRSR